MKGGPAVALRDLVTRWKDDAASWEKTGERLSKGARDRYAIRAGLLSNCAKEVEKALQVDEPKDPEALAIIMVLESAIADFRRSEEWSRDEENVGEMADVFRGLANDVEKAFG